MYFKDLTKYDYLYSGNACNIGWLDNIEPYEKGGVSQEFLDLLWGYFRYPVNVCRGFHTCNLCGKACEGVPVIRHGIKRRKAGFYEIRVWGPDGKEYGAPSLIYHYITEHGYKPPQEFIDAVCNGPRPGSEEYRERLNGIKDSDDFWWREDHMLLTGDYKDIL